MTGHIEVTPRDITCDAPDDDGGTIVQFHCGPYGLDVFSLIIYPESTDAAIAIRALCRALENPVAHLDILDQLNVTRDEEEALAATAHVCEDCGCGHHEVTR